MEGYKYNNGLGNLHYCSMIEHRNFSLGITPKELLFGCLGWDVLDPRLASHSFGTSISITGFVNELWWFILIPIRFVCFICLFGVTVEDVNWASRQNRLVNMAKSMIVTTYAAGTMWLWSNMGAGCLICLLIWSFVSSIRDTQSLCHGGWTSKLVGRDREFVWSIFEFVRDFLRFIVGIEWFNEASRVEKFYLSSYVAALYFITVIYIHGAEIKVTRAVDPNPKDFGKHLSVEFATIVHLLIKCLYECYTRINFLSTQCWARLLGRRLVLAASAPETSEVDRTGSSLQSSIGRNVNGSGTQTIGRVSIRGRGDVNVTL